MVLNLGSSLPIRNIRHLLCLENTPVEMGATDVLGQFVPCLRNNGDALPLLQLEFQVPAQEGASPPLEVSEAGAGVPESPVPRLARVCWTRSPVFCASARVSL